MSHDDAWMRDVGPTFVTNDEGVRRGVDWRFNAWGGLDGGLYFPWDKDDAVARKVLEIEGCDRYRAPFINEGGAIHVDGEGTALVTEQCLLNANRNPGLSRERIDELLCAFLGVRKVLWLGAGVIDDETDGHVDNLACFVKPGVVALHWTDNRRDPQYAVSCDALERLRAARDARNRPLEVIKLPMPGPLRMTAAEARGIIESETSHRREAGMRLAATYVNF
jgi:agmatine deiminase